MTSPPLTRNWPDVPATFFLALAEGEPGEVAHVLAAQPEVGIDIGRREPSAQPRQPPRPSRGIGVRPAGTLVRRRWRREVGRLGQPGGIPDVGHQDFG